MRYSWNKIIVILSIALIYMGGVFYVADAYGEDKDTRQRLIGTWWTPDATDTPWAIQFNENGTFRTATTQLRLKKSPTDEGRFKLEGSSLTLISNKDCKGPCKGLSGHYKVVFTKFDRLQLEEQKDPCEQRKEVCCLPWVKVLK